MEQWRCFRCKEKMVDDEVYLSYLDVDLPPIQGMRCPKCGAAYLSEQTVVEKVVKAEERLEKK